MFNPTIDAYGIRKIATAVQPAAGGTVTSGGTLAQVSNISSVQAKTQAANAASKLAFETMQKQLNKEDVSEAVKKLNEFVAPALQSIEFSTDEESDRVIVKVVDTATNKVLRQIPNEEVLAISRTLDRLQGLVIRQMA